MCTYAGEAHSARLEFNALIFFCRCATALEKLAGDIKCDFTCTYAGETLSARLEFNVHMVGLNRGTYEHPDLQVSPLKSLKRAVIADP